MPAKPLTGSPLNPDFEFWLHAGADILLIVGCLAIAVTFFAFLANKSKEFPHHWVLRMAALSSLFAAFASIADLIGIWAPMPVSSTVTAAFRFAGGVATIFAAFFVIRFLPMLRSMRDISKLETANNDLAAANAAMQKLREDAEQASLLKSASLAHVSHELRTPLAGVIGMIELLQDTKLDEEQKMLVASCAASAQSLLTITNDVLDLSSIETGRMHIQVVSFAPKELVQECCSILAEAARRKKLFITTNIDPAIPDVVLGDPKRLRQALVNLISNAIKFTTSGGVVVSLTLHENRQIDCAVRFAVKDTGVGLSEDEQEKLFQPFTHVDGTSARRYGGTGLGLFISKRIVELMHGTIGVESKKGEGSTFWFDLALSRPGDGVSPRSVEKIIVTPQLTGKALIVEDNPTLQALAIRQLASLGLQATAVSTGTEAIELVSRERFDLILMDCYLPELDGFEATKNIRKIEELNNEKRVPIVAMTASAIEGDQDRCLASGMDDYLSKPVSMDQLREKVKRWLASAAANEASRPVPADRRGADSRPGTQHP
jgi:signal transduction histidine kinase/ActR/RegA family two-component response regulator